MPEICPAILASSVQQYKEQVEKVAGFAHRIQIDLTDGIFAQPKTVGPEQAWWPVGFKADFHLMYKNPLAIVRPLTKHRPNLIIVHAEAGGDFVEVADFCHERGVEVGVALLQKTAPEAILPSLEHIDHILVFGGELGSFGGRANLKMLDKVRSLKNRKAELEIGWDGGINDQNISEIVSAGVDVLNVGGYLQKAPDPARAFLSLQRIAEETGTT